MYKCMIKKGFHRNQKDVGMAVANNWWRIGWQVVSYWNQVTMLQQAYCHNCKSQSRCDPAVFTTPW